MTETPPPPPQGPPPGQPPTGQPPGELPGEQPGEPLGPPPPAPAGGSNRSKLVLFLILGLVVVAGIVVALVLALGGDDDEDADGGDSGGGGDDAEAVVAVVETWTNAAKEGDCDAAIGVMTDDLVEEAGECKPEEFEGASEFEFEIGEAEIDGDSATVPVTASFEGEEQPIDFRLTQEDDEWLISGYGTIGEGATSETPSP